METALRGCFRGLGPSRSNPAKRQPVLALDCSSDAFVAAAIAVLGSTDRHLSWLKRVQSCCQNLARRQMKAPACFAFDSFAAVAVAIASGADEQKYILELGEAMIVAVSLNGTEKATRNCLEGVLLEEQLNMMTATFELQAQ